MYAESVKNKTVLMDGVASYPLYFVCSDIIVGDWNIAGTWLALEKGDVVPLKNIARVVDPAEAVKEVREWQRRKDKERIKEVVQSVASAEEEFSGNIILGISFTGSLQKTKALTKQEQELYLPVEMRAKLKGGKLLFESPEYDSIESFKAQRRQEFANLGIPFPLGVGMQLVRIINIPKAEDLAKKTEMELQGLVRELQGAYPSQITPEAVQLGPLYNAGDYKAPEALAGLFKFKTKWMHFGVPDVLREIDQALWEKERRRTAEVWKEAKEQGLILLRQTVAKLTERLVDAVTPDKDGNKKRFYATTVTNLQDFFEVFEDRNLADDKDLAAQVSKLKELISNKEIASFKDDDVVRSYVKSEGAKIQSVLETMLVDSGLRTITFDDQ